MATANDKWLQIVRSFRKSRFRWEVTYKPSLIGPIPKTTSVGEEILKYVREQKRKQNIPPRRNLPMNCFEATSDRVKIGWKRATGIDLLHSETLDRIQLYKCIIGSERNRMHKVWKKVPRHLRYRGVPGALVFLNKGYLYQGKDAWTGLIHPGSPLQFWWPRYSLGHSAILERYVIDEKGKVIALVYSDQWVDYRVLLRDYKGPLNYYIIGIRFK